MELKMAARVTTDFRAAWFFHLKPIDSHEPLD